MVINMTNYVKYNDFCNHDSIDNYYYGDVIMSAMASQITSLTIVCSTIYQGADRRKHQSSASLASVRGLHRWLVNSPHKGPVTLKMFPLWRHHVTFQLKTQGQHRGWWYHVLHFSCVNGRHRGTIRGKKWVDFDFWEARTAPIANTFVLPEILWYL